GADGRRQHRAPAVASGASRQEAREEAGQAHDQDARPRVSPRVRLVARVLMLVAASGLAAQAASLLRRSAPPPWRLQLAALRPVGEGERFVQPLDGGGRIELTLLPRVQRAADELLTALNAPYAGAVLLSVDEGRVLALSGRAAADRALGPAE